MSECTQALGKVRGKHPFSVSRDAGGEIGTIEADAKSQSKLQVG